MDKKLQVEVKKALEIAASALLLAIDWNLIDAQVDPLIKWDSDAYTEMIKELAAKLKELAGQL